MKDIIFISLFFYICNIILLVDLLNVNWFFCCLLAMLNSWLLFKYLKFVCWVRLNIQIRLYVFLVALIFCPNSDFFEYIYYFYLIYSFHFLSFNLHLFMELLCICYLWLNDVFIISKHAFKWKWTIELLWFILNWHSW